MSVVLFHIFVWGVSLLLCLGNGFALLQLVCGRSETLPEDEEWLAVTFVTGLLLQLSLIFGLSLLRLPLVVTVPLSLLPGLLILPRFWSWLTSLKPWFNLNFVLWFFVTAALGVSLFGAGGEITTPWVNNYGDLAFHIGMITSFVTQSPLLFHYHIYPGEILSYPFFVNLWSATLWWDVTDFRLLSVIFFVQWTSIWISIYFLVKGNRLVLFPWLILFGGGSYFVLDAYSWTELNKGYPWTVFLTTVWVTQRGAMIGAAASLTVLTILHQAETAIYKAQRRRLLIAAAIVLAMMPLIHTHFFMVTALVCGSYLMLKVIVARRSAAPGVVSFKDLLIFCGVSCLAILFFPVLLQKTGMMALQAGWIVGKRPDTLTGSVAASVSMWLKNAPLWFLCVAIFWWYRPKTLFMVPLCAVFLFGNVVLLASWSWDQLKIFLALYVLWIGWYSRNDDKEMIYLHLACLPLMVPGLIEGGMLFLDGPNHTVYSKADFVTAAAIREHTPADAIIAAKSLHNSPVTLTGRYLYTGYEGTLSSHQISYHSRKKALLKLSSLTSCHKNDELKPCPDFILWTTAERELWRGQDRKGLSDTGSQLILRIEGND